MPCARSRASSCFRRAPPSSMNERSDTNLRSPHDRRGPRTAGCRPRFARRRRRRVRRCRPSCGERLDRALPAHLRMCLSKEAIGGEIVDRHRDHETPSTPASGARSGSLHAACAAVEHVVRQDRFLRRIRWRLNSSHAGVESLRDFGDHSRRAENRELRAERGEQVTAMTLPPMIGMDGDLVDERP